MSNIRRGLFFSLNERFLLIGISLTGAMLLARLLTPEEIGIYSVSLAVIGIAQVMRDFGIGNFLIQERNLSEAHIRTAFGFALLMGCTLFLIVFLAAPLAGEFYADERLVKTMRISAINFLVLPFCSISLSLLRRSMMFKRLAAVGVTAAITGFSVSVSLAYAGHGPNSMAFGAVASNLMTGTLAWIARTDRKLLLPSLTEWRVILKFGTQSSAASIVTTISMDINDLALGRILGFAPVAMISRAQGLMNLFHRDIMAAVRVVMYPAFAQAHRDGESVDAQYVRSVTNVTAFAWPFYGFAALYADQLIRLMFGTQWAEAAHLVPVFCLAGAFAATSNLALNAVIAVGRIELATRADLFLQPFRAILIIGAAILFESLYACAIAFLISTATAVPTIYFAKHKCIPTNFLSLGKGLMDSAKLTLITLTIPSIIAALNTSPESPTSILGILLLAAVTSGVAWIFGIIFLDHPVQRDQAFQSLIRNLGLLTRKSD